MADKTPKRNTERLFTASSAHTIEDIRRAKREWSPRLLRHRKVSASRALTAAISAEPILNVVGVGVGEKLTSDGHTGIMALKFLVRAKLPQSQLSGTQMLPREVDGIPTDVEEVGLVRKFATLVASPAAVNPLIRMRPAAPGCSIGFADPANQFVMAGTFGALVRDASGTYILSNNHVLADEGRLSLGSPIYQPGLLDGGDPATDQIAELTRFVALIDTTPNHVDCAIAAVQNVADVTNVILDIGSPAGTAGAQIDMAVQKFGRTTAYTAGQITSIDTDVTVQYETGNYIFESQIIIVSMDGGQFSDAGDSGSLIVERGSNSAVGLLFAGSSTHTIANHISEVLSALNVSLA